VHDYRVTGNYICDNTQTALELAEIILALFCAKREPEKELTQGMLVPCFPHQEEWWLDLTPSSANANTSPGACNTS
jgi:hypothetical protein